ncbi:MAG: DUF1669 domain-containing protein [Ignavibacteriae bacterium]|nr:DUF1669 domain-containing protein [Ignavibacteriota bacterium]
MSKTLLFTSLLCWITFPAFSQTQTRLDIEFVESIPIETTLDNPDIRNTFGVWMEMINGAKKTLDIEQFYISSQKGEPLDTVLNAIIAASVRGVKVRLIVDARMYKTYPEHVDQLKYFGLKAPDQFQIEVRIIDFGKLAGGVQHAKYFIVDGEEVLLGSQNFDWRALKHIHELGLRIKHKEVVKVFQDIFELDWQIAKTNDPRLVRENLTMKSYSLPAWVQASRGDTVWLFPTASPKGLIPDSSIWDEKNIIELIDGAKSEVVLQFLSYSPVSRDKSFYPVLDNALRSAAVHGVKVKMIVSDWEKDHPAVDHLKSLSLVPNIEVKFSVIPEWSGGYIPYARVEHCKFICVDGISFWLGTSNGEKSYFYTSRNLGIIVKNLKLANTLHRIFMKSWESVYTELVKPEVEYQPRRHGEN